MSIVCMDALEHLKTLQSDSIDLILTDPPYFKMKKIEWDRAWDSSKGFLDWMGQLCVEWKRVLKQNGSIYVFSSDMMGAHVQILMEKHFHVLNNIIWKKSGSDVYESGMWNRNKKTDMRKFFPQNETIIFGEKPPLNNFAKYPIVQYFKAELARSNVSLQDVNKFLGVAAMASHYFTHHQWSLMGEDKYYKLRGFFNSETPSPPPYKKHHEKETMGFQACETLLGADYAFLKNEYTETVFRDRRVFQIKDFNADNPITNVWQFTTVPFYEGKHPCEKPQKLLEFIIKTNSLPGQIVLDSFSGSGATGVACKKLGRGFIGCDFDQHWVDYGMERISSLTSV